MLPEHQSSDAARQGRTYRSTASAKQVRFPVRRSKLRGRDNGVQKRENASLKQQTLTQMDFVSSFGEEIILADDDASDGTACDPDKPAIPRRTSEAQLAEKPQESMRESTPVIQDSFGSPDCSFLCDMPAEVSPLRFRSRQVRDAAISPRPMGRMGPLDAVKASPRRRAHWSRNLEGSKRLKQSSQADDISSPACIHSSAEDADDREIPDSDEEYEELELRDYRLIHQDMSATGHETQLALEELASLEYPDLDEQDTVTNQLLTLTPHSPTLTSSEGTANSKLVLPIEATECPPIMKATATATATATTLQLPTASTLSKTAFEPHHQTELSQGRQGQVFESQRVPLHVLQSFTPVSARTDILLPTPSDVLGLIVDGSETFLHLTYRVPEQVRRFWLFDQETLRYMACVQPGKPRGVDWDYHVDQIYELNNPVEERDMQEEGWVTGQVRRYIYLPPAIVGQLLWNLRCAAFDRGGLQKDDENDRESSNAGALGCRLSEYNYNTRNPVIPSQLVAQFESYPSHHDTSQPSSLLFQDHGSSIATLPTNAAFDSSPLLTKSQMLSDSLVSDDLL